jgi:hypothetical protein
LEEYMVAVIAVALLKCGEINHYLDEKVIEYSKLVLKQLKCLLKKLEEEMG